MRVLLAILATSAALGQSPATPAFDVVSVKPSQPHSHGFIGALPAPGKLFRGFTGTDVRLIPLVMIAYGVDERQFSLKGAPDWVATAGFDIDAKTETPVSYEQIQAMLQTLLADRFKLKLRHEIKEERIYALVVEKNPPNLTPHEDDGTPPLIELGDKPGERVFQNLPVARLIMVVAGETGHKVIDKTGLRGSYDFKLTYMSNQTKGPRDEDALDDPGAPIDAVLRKQLGLKLEAQRGPVDYLFIEHVEKPSAN